MENLTTRSATLVSAASISPSMNHRMSRARSPSNITRDIGPGRAVHNCRSVLAAPARDRAIGARSRLQGDLNREPDNAPPPGDQGCAGLGFGEARSGAPRRSGRSHPSTLVLHRNATTAVVEITTMRYVRLSRNSSTAESMPRSWCSPTVSNDTSLFETRSRTAAVTRMEPGSAAFAARAAVFTIGP